MEHEKQEIEGEHRHSRLLMARIGWYASLVLTLLGVVLTIVNPHGVGRIVGFVGFVGVVLAPAAQWFNLKR
jgi:hypothetical protein